MRALSGKWRAHYIPPLKKRTARLRRLKELFRRHQSQPVGRVIELINPIPRGLGDLLRRRSFGPVLSLCAGLGEEHSKATLNAGAEAHGVRLEEVE